MEQTTVIKMLLHYDQGSYKEAIRFLDKAIRLKPDFVKAHCLKGYAFFNLRKYDEAIECFDICTELDPIFLDAWCHRGSA